jgi:signal transduction histidine kinase
MRLHTVPMTEQANPYIRDTDGHWMRRYLEWAGPYYDRFPEPQRSEAAAFDRWLYSKRSLPGLVAMLALTVGLVLAITAAGVTLGVALVLVAVTATLCFVSIMRAWLGTEGIEHISKKPIKGWRRDPLLGLLWITAIGYLGSPVGYMVGRSARNPELVSVAQLWVWGLESLRAGAPFMLAVVGLASGVLVVTQAIRKQRNEHALERLRIERERDAQSALAAQAQLKVLQAQVKPHFLFNTLAATQHWIDTQDSRASGLLQSLTNFLRRSTDSMDKDLVPLANELALVQDYLHIMQRRMGEQKLQWSVQTDVLAAQQAIPPALLLSLVENAVEHGIDPALRGGRIDITATHSQQGVCVQVSDTGVGLHETTTEHVGLTNSRARLAAQFGNAATLNLMPNSHGQGATARVWFGAPPTNQNT